jgi:ABC-type nitrate/sulfonate/bicarbonate transport system permease component
VIVWSARTLIVGAFIAIWQSVGANSAIERLIFSTPSHALSTFGRGTHDGTFWRDLQVTLTDAVFGYLVRESPRSRSPRSLSHRLPSRDTGAHS